MRPRLAACLAFLVAGTALLVPAVASAYSECGDPPGPSKNVTTVGVSCSDGHSFARRFASSGIRSTGPVTFPGWREYYATVRRVYGGHDVRATRGGKVIRFQVLGGGGASGSGPWLTMGQARSRARREARELASPGERHGLRGCDRVGRRRVDCDAHTTDDLDDMECTFTVTVVKRRSYGQWYVDSSVRGLDCHSR